MTNTNRPPAGIVRGQKGKTSMKLSKAALEKMNKTFCRVYSKLYDDPEMESEGWCKELLTKFDTCAEMSFKETVCDFVKYRGDYLTSDREVIAFMVAAIAL